MNRGVTSFTMEQNDQEMDDDSWEEELVMVDLSGLIDSDWFSKIGNVCKIVGVDSDAPILQLGKHIFTGSYSDSIGTRVLFEKQSPSSTGNRTIPQSLKYFGHTFKVLNMNKIFLGEKDDAATKDGHNDASEVSVQEAVTEQKSAEQTFSSCTTTAEDAR